MSDIPADIMKAAAAVILAWEPFGDHGKLDQLIARALVAERERCVSVLNNFITDVDVEIDGRSRFTIGDINRECKKSVRYVRDQITGDFDKNWLERPSEKIESGANAAADNSALSESSHEEAATEGECNVV